MKSLRICAVILVLLSVMVGCKVASNPKEDTSAEKKSTFEEFTNLDWKQEKTNSGGVGSPYYYIYQPKAVAPMSDDVYGFAGQDVVKQISDYNNANIYEQTEHRPIDIMQFVEEYKYPKEKLIAENLKTGAGDPYYTDEEIELIYSGNREAFMKHFMSDNGWYYQGKIYVPIWFAHYPLSKWVEVGFNKTELSAYITRISEGYTAENKEAVLARLAAYPAN